jgi:hypothetical protein
MTTAVYHSTVELDAAPSGLALFSGAPAPAPRTLLDILDATTRDHPNEPALDDGTTVLSYRALAAEVDTLRAASATSDWGSQRRLSGAFLTHRQ